MVARVLTTIQMMAALTLPFSGSWTFGMAGGSSSALSMSLPISISSMALTFTKLLVGLLPPFFSSSIRSASEELRELREWSAIASEYCTEGIEKRETERLKDR
jgi:hypothetical protein